MKLYIHGSVLVCEHFVYHNGIQVPKYQANIVGGKPYIPTIRITPRLNKFLNSFQSKLKQGYFTVVDGKLSKSILGYGIRTGYIEVDIQQTENGFDIFNGTLNNKPFHLLNQRQHRNLIRAITTKEASLIEYD